MILLGTADVWNTSLKRSLMELPFDLETNSTIVSDISYVKPVFRDQKKLKTVTSDNELNEMAQLLATICHSRSVPRPLLS